MRRRLIRLAFFLLALLSVALMLLAAFFFWASSGTLSEDELASTATYAAEPAPPRDTFAVMTYNIGYLSGMTNNRPVVRSRTLFANNLVQAARLIQRADPDVVGFQEIDFGASRSFDVDQLGELAERLGYAASATAVNWDERYLPFPYGRPAVHFGRVLSGQAILSRYPILEHERIELSRTSRPFYTDALYLDRLAQVAVIDLGGRPVAVVNVHLEAFEEAARETQASEVRRVAERYAAHYPTLLIGDFNAPADAARAALPPEERAHYADDETLALLLGGTAFRPAMPDSVQRRPVRAVGTFPADAPAVKIDHIFYTPATIRPAGAPEILGGGANPPSDHRAVLWRFTLAN